MTTQRDFGWLRLRRSWIALATLALLALLAWVAFVYRPAVAEEVVVRSYSCPPGQAAAIADQLREEIGPGEGIRVAADDRTSQVVVQAPQTVQTWVARRLGANTEPKGSGDAPAGSKLVRTQIVSLQRMKAPQVETALGDILGERFMALSRPRDPTRKYRMTLAGGSLELSADSNPMQVTLAGAPTLVDSAARLIQILDGPSENGRGVRVMPLRTASMTDIQHITAAIRTVSNAAPSNISTAAYQARAGASAAVPAAAGPAGAGGALPPAAAPAAGGQPGATTGLVNPVQVELLEGLDVIVLRGTPQDVATIAQVIETIDRLSVITEPEIKIIPVRHVDCEQLAVMLRTLYDEVFHARQGNVSITPVITPNELLVVGRKENVITVAGLVEKLDQPMNPDAQFRVFQLRYAAAATVQTAIASSFAPRGGLSPVVVATADTRTNALIVQASPRDMLQVAELIGNLDTMEKKRVNEVRIIKLDHATASDVAAILQNAIGVPVGGTTAPGGAAAAPAAGGAAAQRAEMLRFLTVDSRGRRLLNTGILSDVNITTDVRANAIVVTAPAEDMELIEALVHQIDLIPAAEAQIKVFTIVNGDASSLTTMLGQLFGVPTTGTGGAAQAVIQTVTAGGDTTVVPLHFGVDARTNSIIASGTMGDLNVVEAVLTKLDDSDVRKRKSVVIRLKNSPATSVANTLTTFLANERSFESQTQGLTTVYEMVEREIVIVPETVTNSLVLSATPRFFDEIRGIIEQLDARPSMVTIQVMIASVELGDTNEFGIELGLQDTALFDRGILSNLVTTTTTTTAGASTQQVIAANNQPGFNFNDTAQPLGNSGLGTNLSPSNVAPQGISNFALGRQNSTLGYGGLVLSAQSENVSALLRALAENHHVEVLQRPQVTAMDNQPANIQVGSNVPYVTGVNTSTTVSGAQQSNISYTQVGVILAITPRITSDGMVVMAIQATKSALEPEASGIPIYATPTGQIIRSPIIDTTVAQTTVSAMDGQTIVIGGLISKNKSESHRKVPWLGDVPLLGNLFRYDSVTDDRTELLIIMTPHIIKTPADAEALKREEAAKMNWCLCDITRIHGESGLCPRGGAWGGADVKVVFPDSTDPVTLPGAPEAVPAPHGQPAAPANVPAPPSTPVPPQPNVPAPVPSGTSGANAPSPGDPISAVPGYPRAGEGQQQPTGQAYPPIRPPAAVEPAAYQRPDANQGQNSAAPQAAVYQQPMGPAPYQPQFNR